MPGLSTNKTGRIPKSVIYRKLIELGYISRTQLAPNTFRRMLTQFNLLEAESNQRMRHSFAMPFANDLWQGDTLYGPSIKQADGRWRKTFLIAFIDDASRLITHAEFFYHDNSENMVNAFRCAVYKRGKPARLYFDNGSNYSAKEILQACLRLDIRLIHAPVRDGAAKGKIERFFRGFRDRFLTQHTEFSSLERLNELASEWIERDYNHHHHSGIGMKPVDRFNLDHAKLIYLTDSETHAEVFYLEEDRKVNATNLFSFRNQRYECPVDLRGKRIQVRHDRSGNSPLIVYYQDKRMGVASELDLHFNARRTRDTIT